MDAAEGLEDEEASVLNEVLQTRHQEEVIDENLQENDIGSSEVNQNASSTFEQIPPFSREYGYAFDVYISLV